MGNVLGCQIWRRCEDDPTSSEILAACPWAGAASDFLARLCDTSASDMLGEAAAQASLHAKQAALDAANKFDEARKHPHPHHPSPPVHPAHPALGCVVARLVFDDPTAEAKEAVQIPQKQRIQMLAQAMGPSYEETKKTERTDMRKLQRVRKRTVDEDEAPAASRVLRCAYCKGYYRPVSVRDTLLMSHNRLPCKLFRFIRDRAYQIAPPQGAGQVPHQACVPCGSERQDKLEAAECRERGHLSEMLGGSIVEDVSKTFAGVDRLQWHTRIQSLQEEFTSAHAEQTEQTMLLARQSLTSHDESDWQQMPGDSEEAIQRASELAKEIAEEVPEGRRMWARHGRRIRLSSVLQCL
eukprot:s3095_g4.t1